jgi:hypothetical protein
VEFYVSFLLRVGYGFFGVKRPVAWSGRDSRLRRVKRWRSGLSVRFVRGECVLM